MNVPAFTQCSAISELRMFVNVCVCPSKHPDSSIRTCGPRIPCSPTSLIQSVLLLAVLRCRHSLGRVVYRDSIYSFVRTCGSQSYIVEDCSMVMGYTNWAVLLSGISLSCAAPAWIVDWKHRICVPFFRSRLCNRSSEK